MGLRDIEAWRVPFVVGSVGRLAYGLGSVLARSGWEGASRRRCATTPDGARSALRLNTLVDGLDAVVSLLEWRDRGRLDERAAGGVASNVIGLTCWSLARAALRDA